MMKTKDMGARENGVRACVVQDYSPTHPRITLQRRHFLFGGSCWVKGIEFKLATKTWVRKKKFLLQVFLIIC